VENTKKEFKKYAYNLITGPIFLTVGCLGLTGRWKLHPQSWILLI
jgi:hypothetical protein